LAARQDRAGAVVNQSQQRTLAAVNVARVALIHFGSGALTPLQFRGRRAVKRITLDALRQIETVTLDHFAAPP
jgi:hypothetical protein